MMVNISNARSIISDACSVAGRDVKRLINIVNPGLMVPKGTLANYHIAAGKRVFCQSRNFAVAHSPSTAL